MPETGLSARAFLSLGSNLGERLETLKSAVRALGVNEHVEVKNASEIYETDPVEVASGHPDYLNCVLEIACSMPPMELLRYCQGIEAALGRDAKGEMAPRTIDIDILLYGDEVVESRDLAVPHRGITRPFNLKCLVDIDENVEVPGHGKVGELLEKAEISGVRAYGGSLR